MSWYDCFGDVEDDTLNKRPKVTFSGWVLKAIVIAVMVAIGMGFILLVTMLAPDP